jgi:hypothetical protein
MTSVDLSALSDARRYRDLADRMIEVEVIKARHNGFTWGQIGGALGITHQGARSRHAAAVRKAVASVNSNGAESPNGLLRAPDHARRVDSDSAPGPGDDGD